MLFGLGAASSVIDLLSSLTKKGSSSQAGAAPFDVSSSGQTASDPNSSASQSVGGGTLSPGTFAALLNAQSQTPASSQILSPSTAENDLFSQIDSNGDGAISKSEFEDKLGAGGTNVQAADDVFSKLDTDGNGSVSQDEVSSALKSLKGGGHHHHAKSTTDTQSTTSADGASSDGTSTDSDSTDPLLQALDSDSSSSTKNSDGSTTTTVTYADGSKITLISAASSTSGQAAASTYDQVQKLADLLKISTNQITTTQLIISPSQISVGQSVPV
jgi:Ca2+-binding EF-hand superfamily protein